MKKIKYLVPMLMIFAVILSGCGKSDVVGKWEVPAGNVDLGTHGDYYEFDKDGTYFHDNHDSIAAEKGKYEIDGNTIKIKGKFFAMSDSKPFTYKLKLSEDKKSFKHKGKTYEKETEKEKEERKKNEQEADEQEKVDLDSENY